MIIPIKNMVCARCIKSVTGVFKNAGIPLIKVELGSVEIKEPLPKEQEEKVRQVLIEEGFEWIDSEKIKLVEQVKQVIRQLVQQGELDEMNEKLSVYLSRKMQREYSYIAAIFSSVENTTVEQFFILQKIERVKEWLVYDELTLSEIAFKLGYSSVSHLSFQFKNITGFTPTRFKDLKDHQRKPLDEI